MFLIASTHPVAGFAVSQHIILNNNILYYNNTLYYILIIYCLATLDITELSDHGKLKLFLSLIKKNSRRFQKLLKYFNGAVTLTFLVLLLPTSHNTCFERLT